MQPAVKNVDYQWEEQDQHAYDSYAAFTRTRYPDIWISGSQRSGYLRGVYTYRIETFSAFTRVSPRKRSRQTSWLAIIRFLPFSLQWQYKGNNERTKNKEIFTRTWVWGFVLRVCVRSVRVRNVRVTSSACIYQLLWWVRALCALKQCKTGHKIFVYIPHGSKH